MQAARIRYLEYESILFIHLVLVDEFFTHHYEGETTRYGILQEERIHAAAGRPRAGMADGREFYPTVPLKAAALIHSLIKGHAFVDANKRTGILSGWVFLSLNGTVSALDQDQLYELALDIEADRFDIETLGSILGAFLIEQT